MESHTEIFLDRTIRWRSETPSLFSATLETGQGRCYLIVERLPDGGWDWVVWAHGRKTSAMHGKAGASATAMNAAERAARMQRTGVIHFLIASGTSGLHNSPISAIL